MAKRSHAAAVAQRHVSELALKGVNVIVKLRDNTVYLRIEERDSPYLVKTTMTPTEARKLARSLRNTANAADARPTHPLRELLT